MVMMSSKLLCGWTTFIMYCNTTKFDGDQPSNSGVMGCGWILPPLGLTDFKKPGLNSVKNLKPEISLPILSKIPFVKQI